MNTDKIGENTSSAIPSGETPFGLYINRGPLFF